MTEETKLSACSLNPTAIPKDSISHNIISKYSPEDEKELYKLQLILKDEFKIVETAERSTLLCDVLARLHTLIQDWVCQIAKKRKLSEEIISKTGGELFVSGSFRLGVHGQSSDLDALCVVPKFIDRDEDFFGDFFNILSKNSDITDLRGIKDAYVPLMKMKFCNIDIDLLFARLRFNSIDSSLKSLKDDSVLLECDDQTINSLNTYRNNDLILSLVPNQETFKETLKYIKVWAKRRDLYSNKVGFLGGISWAILTAKICQLFPMLPPNRLLEKFFSSYYKWNWKIPVLLRDIKEPSEISLQIKQWNPKLSEGDQQQIMPIITPAFPCVNSAFNVSKVTKKILLEEFHRAAKITKRINNHKIGYNWMNLFQKYDFFKKFTHYLRIDALSSNPEQHLKWEGFVESKIRLLIQELEICSQDICNIRLYTKPFNLSHPEYKQCTTFLCGFNFREPQKLPNYNQEYIVDLRAPILKFCEKIMGMCYRPDKSNNMRITHTTLDKLPVEIFENGIKPKHSSLDKISKKEGILYFDHHKNIIDIPVEGIPLVQNLNEESVM